MSPCSVLVVDDELPLLRVVVPFLQEEGYAVRSASTGHGALTLLVRQPPTVLLLDMHLPDMNGAAVAHYTREHRLPSRIVVLTAAHDAKDAAERLAADGYVAKPFALLQLLRTVERLCPAMGC